MILVDMRFLNCLLQGVSWIRKKWSCSFCCPHGSWEKNNVEVNKPLIEKSSSLEWVCFPKNKGANGIANMYHCSMLLNLWFSGVAYTLE